MIDIREARMGDVDKIRDLFVQVYGTDYPFKGFYDTEWLTKIVYDDNTLFHVLELDGEVVMTCSVNLSVGGMEDMIGEIGRLVAATDERVRGKGYALEIVREVQNRTGERVQFLFGEARTPHRGSQRILEELNWIPAGYEPMKYLVSSTRENMVLYIHHQGMARELRCNNPRLIPEAVPLAETVLSAADFPVDVIVDHEEAGYPTGQAFSLERLSARGLSSLLRIERGRLVDREVFGGNISLSHGFFQISNSQTYYLVARDGEVLLGAVGYLYDPIDLKVRIIELIEFDDAVKGFLLASVERVAREEHGAVYMEIDVSAYSPKIQRTLERLGFIPVAYCPSMVFDNVERIDILRMARITCPYDPGEMKLLDSCIRMKEIVEKSMDNHVTGIQITAAVKETDLFRNLPEGEMYHLARISLLKDYPEGTELVRQGMDAEKIYTLLEGTADVKIGGETIGAIEAGTFFGEMALVEEGKRNADVILTSESRVIEVPIPTLERMMEARPRLGFQVMRHLARSLSMKLKKSSVDQADPGA